MTKTDSIIGCLLGTAIGDALGLPYEGISRQRQQKMFPDIERYHFFGGRGMISDDTDHTCMVAQSLIVSAGTPARFAQSLAWRFRWWLLGLPAGVGYATLRAILKLWIGFPISRSGVFSAGNGPAMRSGIIGVCYGDAPELLGELVKVSTRMTHTDPKAELGALAAAFATYMAATHSQETLSAYKYYQSFQEFLQRFNLGLASETPMFLGLVEKVCQSVTAGQTTERFAEELGLGTGISGYIYHTIPVVLHCWLRHQHDFRSAVVNVIRCGGDTDTTAAIVGAIVGAGVGKQGIPLEWLDNLWEWPRNRAWMERLGQHLAETISHNTQQKAVPLPISGLLLRNLFFLCLVLSHGIRRIFPPYE